MEENCEPKKYYSIARTAEFLGVKETYLRRMHKEGRLIPDILFEDGKNGPSRGYSLERLIKLKEIIEKKKVLEKKLKNICEEYLNR